MLEMIPLAIFDASEFFQWFVDHASYLFVFVFMVIESSFIPFPSEVIVPPAAYLACTNTGAGSDMNIFLVVVFATLGALVGAFINYYLALWIGRPVVYTSPTADWDTPVSSTGRKWRKRKNTSTVTEPYRPSSDVSFPPYASSFRFLQAYRA